MRKAINYILLLAGTLFTGDTLSAQSSTSSPYSRFGIGELQQSGMPNSTAMGGISVGLADPDFINVINPASFSFLKFSNFDVGVNSNTIRRVSKGGEQIVNNTAFSHVTFGFPGGRRWGLAFGVVPVSTSGYKIKETQTVSGVGQVDYTYEGSGGLNRLFVGNAYKVVNRKATDSLPYRTLSLGMNASYLFGVFTRTRRVEYPDAVNYFHLRVKDATSVGDLYFNYGALYSHQVKWFRKERIDTISIADPVPDQPGYRIRKREAGLDSITVSFGVTLNLPADITTRQDTLAETYEKTVVSDKTYYSIKDTALNVENRKGIMQFPLGIGAGITVMKEGKWILGAEVQWQQWSAYLSPSSINEDLQNSIRAALGGQLIPRSASAAPYLQRMHYRAGVYYHTGYLSLNGNRISEAGATAGLGFPIRVKKIGDREVFSYFNLTLDAGQRGRTEVNPVKEQYARLMFGFSFHDVWFQRGKYR